MRILKRRKIGYISAVIILSVCFVDLISTILINSIDQQRASYLLIDTRGNAENGQFSHGVRIAKRKALLPDYINEEDFRDMDDGLEMDSVIKGIKKTFLDSLKDFFLPKSGHVVVPLPKKKVKRIWSSGVNEHDDRIINQMSHIPKGINASTPLKTIVVMTGGMAGAKPGQERFLLDECPFNRCYLTNQKEYAKKADALLWQLGLSVPKFAKPSNQIWAYYALESPHNTYQSPEMADKFNWTCTYRMDSTIVTPYEKFVPFKNFSGLPDKPLRNYASGKTKNIAWFVSNCQTKNNRRGYVSELRKYIDVDIYGGCGELKCNKMNKEDCFTMLSNTYKYYLAFENSNCKDYITEKFFVNGLQHDVIPIVMGARREEYELVAPQKSFIHVDDFESPKDLAEYLKKLNQNDDLYNEYFRWKGTGEFINTKFWCRLCAMVHAASSAGHRWYRNLWDWWAGPNVCVKSTPSNLFASWRYAGNETNALDAENLKKKNGI